MPCAASCSYMQLYSQAAHRRSLIELPCPISVRVTVCQRTTSPLSAFGENVSLYSNKESARSAPLSPCRCMLVGPLYPVLVRYQRAQASQAPRARLIDDSPSDPLSPGPSGPGTVCAASRPERCESPGPGRCHKLDFFKSSPRGPAGLQCFRDDRYQPVPRPDRKSVV